jgi:hypothetical protein
MITEYESELPLESARSLINQVRTKTIDKRQFGLDLLNVQSYAMGRALESPRRFGAAPTHAPSDEEAFAALQTLEPEAGLVGAHISDQIFLILKWALNKALSEFLN